MDYRCNLGHRWRCNGGKKLISIKNNLNDNGINTTEAIQKRLSIRHYDPAFKVSKKDIRELIALAMLSATSYNIQHWKFVVITDPKLREAIRAASFDQSQVTDATSLILVFSDWSEIDRFYKMNYF